MITDKPAITVEPPTTGCASGCKRSVPTSELGLRGWTLLQISGRWRCPDCWRELEAINRAPGEATS